MHLACSDWSILNSDGSDLTSGTQCRFKVRQGTSDRRPSIRTDRGGRPRFEELKAWKEVFRYGLSANTDSCCFNDSFFITHRLWRHYDVIMTHYGVAKRTSFHFWFVFCDLLHNSLPLFSIVSSIHMENGLFWVNDLKIQSHSGLLPPISNFYNLWWHKKLIWKKELEKLSI